MVGLYSGSPGLNLGAGLQFQSQIGAAGLDIVPSEVLSGAQVDANFAAGQYFVNASGFVPVTSLISTTRAQTVPSYATDANGNLISFSANTPRITSLGLLVEQGSTNDTWPSTLGSVSYAAGAVFGVSTYPTAAASATIAPDGSTNGQRLTWNGVTARFGTPTNLGNIGVPDGSSIPVTASLWMRAVSGTVSDVTLNLRQYSGVNIATATPTLTTTWQRVTVEGSTVNTQGICGWYLNSAGTSVIEIWGYQIEPLAFATSYIPTTTVSVARAADVVTAIGALLATLKLVAASTVVSIPALSSVATFPRVIGSGPNAQGLPNIDATKVLAAIYNGSTSSPSQVQATIPDATLNALKIACGWNASGRSIVGNGGTVATDAGQQTSDTTYYIGSYGSSAFLNAPLKRLTAFNSRLPDATLKAMTQ